MKQILYFISLFVLIASCNNQSSSDVTEKSLADSLFDQVMAGHDVAMPKMMKLERLQKQTKEAIDSIAKLPVAGQKALAGYKLQLDNALTALNLGDSVMNKWMREFKYDSLQNNEPERIKYLKSELEKVNIMKDAVLGGVQQADSLFGQ
ncbi:MAG: viral A-type inclusion protein [Niabella sp.]